MPGLKNEKKAKDCVDRFEVRTSNLSGDCLVQMCIEVYEVPGPQGLNDLWKFKKSPYI